MTPVFQPAIIIGLLHLEASLILYEIPNRISSEDSRDLEDCCLLFKGKPTELKPPQKASPYVPTWLVENIQFSQILPL